MRARRLPVHDELLMDGELVLLRGQEVLVLSEVASGALTVMDTETWTGLDRLVDELEARFGLPAERDKAVFALLSELVDTGLAELQAD